MRVLFVLVGFLCLGAARRLPQNLPEPVFQALAQGESTIPPSVASLYHSTDTILATIDDMTLSGSCPLVSRHEYKSDDGYKNQFYKVGSGNQTLLVTFSIHGREYITGETALKLTKTLCGVETGANPRYAMKDLERIFSRTQLVFVPILNLDGRRKVERGAPCADQRKNGNNVDLNRNFPGHSREQAKPSDETYPGSAPLSESESVFVSKLASSLRPTGYLDVHSGERAMGWPYAFDAATAPDHEPYLKDVTSYVNDKIFGGKMWQGRLSVMGGPNAYSSQGTTCDYMFDTQKVSYSATWEIFRLSNFMSKSSDAASLAVSDSLALTPPVPNQGVGAALQPAVVPEQNLVQATLAELSGDECFRYFNPMSESSYSSTIRDWSDAVISLAEALDKVPRN